MLLCRVLCFLFLNLIFFLHPVLAQRTRWLGNSEKNWSLEFQGNTAVPIKPESVATHPVGFGSSVGLRYMFHPYIGLRPQYAYQQFSAFERENPSLKNHQITGELVGNLAGLFPYLGNHYYRKFNVLVHGGAGLGYTVQGGKTVDRMATLLLGVTPQYRLGWNWALVGDLTAHGNLSQNLTFDGHNLKPNEASRGYFMRVGIGIHYYLGREQRHVDWR